MNVASSPILAFLMKVFLFIWIVYIPMKTSVYQISFVGISVIFFIYLFLYKQISTLKDILIQNKNLIFAFGLVLVSMTISNSLGKFVTLNSWSTQFHYLFRYFFIFIMLLFFYNKNLITKKFITIIILCALSLQAIDGIYQSIFGYDFIKGSAGSLINGLSGATFNRNNFGFFMTIGISICTALLFYHQEYKLSKINMFTIGTLLLIFLFNLLFTYSRASWLFYGVFVFILFVLDYKKISKKHFFIVLIIAILTVCIFFYFDNLFFRLCQLLQMNDGGRSPIWNDAISLIKENYIFGYGLMTYEYIASQPTLSIHNSVLEIVLFLGVFGFAVFTFLLYLILKEIIKNKTTIYIAFFFAFLVITQFDNSIIRGSTSLSTLSLFAFFIFANKMEKTYEI